MGSQKYYRKIYLKPEKPPEDRYILCCDIIIFSEERDFVLKQLAEKTRQKEQMMSELQAFKDQDPEVIEAIRQETNTAHEAANRWTG